MKMDRHSWVGISILVLLLLIPIVLGQVPAMPKNTSSGWTATISMREEPRKFWSYEASGVVIGLAVFALSRLPRKALCHDDR